VIQCAYMLISDTVCMYAHRHTYTCTQTRTHQQHHSNARTHVNSVSHSNKHTHTCAYMRAHNTHVHTQREGEGERGEVAEYSGREDCDNNDLAMCGESQHEEDITTCCFEVTIKPVDLAPGR